MTEQNIEGQLKLSLGPLMDDFGHLVGGPHHCLACGTELNEGGRLPAETYLGTFNGLCYPCTGAGAHVVAVYSYDGARRVSWPPACPSHRRTREEFFGYGDCEHCGGLGATRGYGHYTPIWERCKSCSDRYWAARPKVDWVIRTRRVVDAMWKAETLALVPKGVRGKKRREEARKELCTSPEAQEIRERLIGRYNRLLRVIGDTFADRYVQWEVKPETAP